jgi:tetratricopeptide (TPR) repeat protein
VEKEFKILYLHNFEQNMEQTFHPLWGLHTTDVATYSPMGEILPTGLAGEQDAALGTGCIVYDESEKLYREALSIKEQLAKSLPQTYEQQLPMALGNLAMACRKSGRLDESEQLLLRAVAIDRKLMVNGDKTTFQRNLLNHLRQLAIVYEKKKDQAKCLQTYQEALSESKTLATAASTVPDVETARLLYAIGTLQIEMERYADALQPLMEAEKIFQAAAKREPNNDSHRSYCENLRKQLEYIKNMTE